jgi:hypothetical protein
MKINRFPLGNLALIKKASDNGSIFNIFNLLIENYSLFMILFLNKKTPGASIEILPYQKSRENPMHFTPKILHKSRKKKTHLKIRKNKLNLNKNLFSKFAIIF